MLKAGGRRFSICLLLTNLSSCLTLHYHPTPPTSAPLTETIDAACNHPVCFSDHHRLVRGSPCSSRARRQGGCKAVWVGGKKNLVSHTLAPSRTDKKLEMRPALDQRGRGALRAADLTPFTLHTILLNIMNEKSLPFPPTQAGNAFGALFPGMQHFLVRRHMSFSSSTSITCCVLLSYAAVCSLHVTSDHFRLSAAGPEAGRCPWC